MTVADEAHRSEDSCEKDHGGQYYIDNNAGSEEIIRSKWTGSPSYCRDKMYDWMDVASSDPLFY